MAPVRHTDHHQRPTTRIQPMHVEHSTTPSGDIVPQPTITDPPGLRAPSIRTKDGCIPCRIRGKKCDLKPSAGVNEDNSCKTCKRLHIQCFGGRGERRDKRLRPHTKQMKETITKHLIKHRLSRRAPRSGPEGMDIPTLKLWPPDDPADTEPVPSSSQQFVSREEHLQPTHQDHPMMYPYNNHLYNPSGFLGAPRLSTNEANSDCYSSDAGYSASSMSSDACSHYSYSLSDYSSES